VESELEKKFEREAEDDEVISLRGLGKIPLKFTRQLAFSTSWSLWGRAISSLDFVELLIRKPSLKRLLTNWSKLVSIVTIKSSEAMEGADTEQPVGFVLSDEMKEKLKRRFLLRFPIVILQARFSNIGGDSISKLLIDVFEEEGLGTPEALGLACLLAIHRPTGWATRIERYIRFLSDNKKNGCKYPRAKARILFETLSYEYFWRAISEETQSSIERLIPQSLDVLGVPKRQRRMVINKLEQDRAKNILVSADFRQ
jgi:hypothetical protein